MASFEEDDSRVRKYEGAEGEASVSGGRNVEEETSPDMLKNTPSNIRKLEDEIENCEGRHKYLAQTRSPSDGGDVRWYFCKVPLSLLQLAASIPNAEVVGKGEYFRFGMRDSLAIEASFLQREEELLSYWWKEYAECSEGPKGQISSSTQGNLRQDPQTSQLYTVEEERVGVPVKGGLYEVDLLKRHCFPVYWNGENRRVLRGHWFAQIGGSDWLPLREDVAEQLESAYRRQVWHRRTFQPSGLFAARVDLQGSTPGLHALFTGEDDTWEALLNVDASGFSSVINFGRNGVKLRRGYAASPSPKPTQDELRQQKEEEMDDYCSQVPVRHLVFMVHGIGQRLEKSNLVDDVTNFRHITASLAEKHLTAYQRDTQRVLFIPCQWRKGLKFSGESAVEKITLDGVRGLRTTLSATVHDVLYYMSPIYCQEIIDSVSNQLNRLYLKFLKRNPGYDGKVSLYGHSLGSVLSYDILCHQENLSSPFPMDFLYTKHAQEDESSRNAPNLSSESDTGASGTATLKEKDNEDKLGRRHGPSTLENADPGYPQADVTACSISSSAPGETSTESKMEAATLSQASYCPDTLSTSGGKTDTLDDATDINHNSTKDIINLDGNPYVSDNVAKDIDPSDTSDNKKDLGALQSEVDSLKARVLELEAQLARNVTCENHEVRPGSLDEDASRKTESGQDDVQPSYKPFIKYTKLEFKVDTFFAVGSPLGVFLAIRNVRIGIGEGREYWEEENLTEEMPACRRMFNIFHPFDPVAYRLEPLVCKEYISKRPVIVPYHRGGKRLHIGLQDFAEDMAARSQSIVNRLNSVRVQVLTVCQSKKKENLEDTEEQAPEKTRTYGSYMMERLSGTEEGRIDHVLQDKTFQHPYVSALGAHTNYWRDPDTALFILKHLHHDVLEDPVQAKVYTSKSEYNWSDSKSLAEEELPLTFSDSLTEKLPKKSMGSFVQT